MSIIDTFDFKGEEIIKAENNVRMIEDFPKTVLVVFSVKLFDLFLSKYDAIKIGALSAGGQKLPIYQFEYKGIKMGLCNAAYWYLLRKFDRKVVLIHIPSIKNLNEHFIDGMKQVFR